MSNFPKITDLLTQGYEVAKSDGGYLATYYNSARKLIEVGTFPTIAAANRACVLWAAGFRFDVMRVDYEAPTTLEIMSQRYRCTTGAIRECIVIGGGTIRDPAQASASRVRKRRVSRPYAGEKLEAARARMLQNKKYIPERQSRGEQHSAAIKNGLARRNKRVDAFAADNL